MHTRMHTHLRMQTSTLVARYEREGLPTPAGQVGDRDGRERTDTVQILKDLVSGQAFLAPLGGVGDEMGALANGSEGPWSARDCPQTPANARKRPQTPANARKRPQSAPSRALVGGVCAHGKLARACPALPGVRAASPPPACSSHRAARPGAGGYKGYGYATVVELLSSALQDGSYSTDCRGVDRETGEKIPMPLGHWFIAINIEHFCPVEQFKSKVGNFLRQMRSSAKDPKGPGRIYTAGELEHDAEEERSANGGTPVPEALLNDMKALRDKFPALAEKYSKFIFEE